MEELVSIVISVYNCEKYIEDCLISVKDQTYKKIEIIIIDDGSSDNTLKKCKEICRNDERFKIYTNENHGVSYSRNFALDRIKGEYVCFIDGDDIVENNFIEVLLKNIKETKSDIAICKIVSFKDKVYRHNDDKEKIKISGTEQLKNVLFTEYGGYLANKMYKVAIIRKNNIKLMENVCVSEDLLFNLDYVAFCNSAIIINKEMYFYRIHSTSCFYNLENRNWFSVLNTYDIILKNNIDIENIVAYHFFMVLIEAKFRFKLNFKDDDLIREKLKYITNKYIYLFWKLTVKQKFKILVFFMFPKQIMKYRRRKVSEDN